jgi:c-di-GMP-binding flagellar brake protein YcgR
VHLVEPAKPGTEHRRKHLRHPLVLSIVYQRAGSVQTERGVGWTRNLSEGGACLELPDPLPEATPLRVALQTDQGSLWMDAEVVWAGRTADAAEGVPHGIAFVQVTAEQARALGSLVDRLGQLKDVAVRVPLRRAVACQLAGTPEPPLRGLTGDVSRRGLSVSLPQRLPEASDVEVTLPTPEGRLTVRAKVTWVDAREGDPDHRVRHGLEFTRLDWTDELTLGLLLAEGAEDPSGGPGGDRGVDPDG